MAIVVTNEVGLGGVPVAPLARLFGDSLGTMNAKLAMKADEVVLMVAGRPSALDKTCRGWVCHD